MTPPPLPMVPAPSISTRTAERHRITCPYCLVGAAVIIIERTGDSIEANLKEPVTCDTCHKYFLVRPQVKLVGKRMEGHRHDG